MHIVPSDVLERVENSQVFSPEILNLTWVVRLKFFGHTVYHDDVTLNFQLEIRIEKSAPGMSRSCAV